MDDVGNRFNGSFFRMVKKPRITLPIVSPVSSSSPTSTHRMENGGSRWAKPSNGGFEQLVTNCPNEKKFKLIETSLKINPRLSVPSETVFFRLQWSRVTKYPKAIRQRDVNHGIHHNIAYVFEDPLNREVRCRPRWAVVTGKKNRNRLGRS